MRRIPTMLLAAALLALAAATAGAAAPAQRSCPAGDRPAPVARRPAAVHVLVPGGARSLVLCRYGGLDQHPGFRLVAAPAVVSDRATVERAAATLDALPVATGPISCPADTGGAIVALFRYASGPDDPVTIGLDGCMEVTNGHVRRLAGINAAGQRLVASLETLVPARRS